MKLRPIFFAVATILFFAAGIFPAAAQPSSAIASAPIYAPDYTHAGEPLPDGVIAWDGLLKSTSATNGQDFARFIFNFTNVASKASIGWATNVVSVTNYTTITNAGFWAWLWGNNIKQIAHVATSTNAVIATNFTPTAVTILTVHPGCSCTAAELPPLPWTIPAGSNGQIKVSVNLAGKFGTLFKQVNVATEQGNKNLMLRIDILPPPPEPEMTEAQRNAGIAAAKVDRQAIFKNDCASCHLKKVEGKYGQQLFDALCAICHEAPQRATMVPDLHNLKVPTNEEFWRAWITSGKAGSLMPAFATSQGGPLNDLQIASLAAYLNAILPSHVPATTTK